MISCFYGKTSLCKGNSFHIPQTELHETFSSYLNWKFISRVRFEDVEDITRNMIVQFYTIWKEEFQRYFNQKKTHWNNISLYMRYGNVITFYTLQTAVVIFVAILTVFLVLMLSRCLLSYLVTFCDPNQMLSLEFPEGYHVKPKTLEED